MNIKVILSRSKIRNKNPGQGFLDFILLFNIAGGRFGRKIIWSSQEYPDFGSKF